MLVGKVRIRPYRGTSESGTFWTGSGLETHAKDKHSSLFGLVVSDGERRFVTSTPGIKKSCDVVSVDSDEVLVTRFKDFSSSLLMRRTNKLDC
jgi:hypothetical protein